MNHRICVQEPLLCYLASVLQSVSFRSSVLQDTEFISREIIFIVVNIAIWTGLKSSWKMVILEFWFFTLDSCPLWVIFTKLTEKNSNKRFKSDSSSSLSSTTLQSSSLRIPDEIVLHTIRSARTQQEKYGEILRLKEESRRCLRKAQQIKEEMMAEARFEPRTIKTFFEDVRKKNSKWNFYLIKWHKVSNNNKLLQITDKITCF